VAGQCGIHANARSSRLRKSLCGVTETQYPEYLADRAGADDIDSLRNVKVVERPSPGLCSYRQYAPSERCGPQVIYCLSQFNDLIFL
jgi:hypothetical protein